MQLTHSKGTSMKYIQGLVVLILLITSKRYREKWRQAREALSCANDTGEACVSQLGARRNGGKPNVRLL